MIDDRREENKLGAVYGCFNAYYVCENVCDLSVQIDLSNASCPLGSTSANWHPSSQADLKQSTLHQTLGRIQTVLPCPDPLEVCDTFFGLKI